jgi:hypothetical protein
LTGATAQVGTAADPALAAVLEASGQTLDPRPESYAVLLAHAPNALAVIGRDEVGAMYGAFELAERIRLDGAAALLALPVLGRPEVPIRAANPFIVLPATGDAEAWYFLDPSYWQAYLDLLAHARMNFLDLHAMYDLDNTSFPNALLYFATSPSFPAVGAPAADRARNLAMLNVILGMAAVRGIQVGLMSYRSDLSLVGSGKEMLAGQLPDADLATYTREAARDLASEAPLLSRLGFRIGESGHDAAWYAETFARGVHDAGGEVRVYTRTWGANGTGDHRSGKPNILSLIHSPAVAGTEVMIEAKYNGEHYGAPYVIAGGKMDHDWSNYSYEDYLEPPQPYRFVFQIRSGGTHRIFREASYARIQRTVGTVQLGGAAGFSLEPPHAYFSQRDDYHADPADRFSPWTFRRDELEYLLFGRLAYDPSTPERVFRAALDTRVGTDGLWDPVQAASEIVPWIQTAHTCGPDSRDFAPELEFGSDVANWARPRAVQPKAGGECHGGAFDTFAVADPDQAAADLLAGRGTTRLSPIAVAALVLDAAARARRAKALAIDASNAEARDVVRECVALADLGDYFGHKLRAAALLGVYAGSRREDYLALARDEAAAADAGWAALAADTSYIAPFDDNLRMTPLGIRHFHWRALLPKLAEDPASIDALAVMVRGSTAAVPANLPAPADWLAAPRGAGPGLALLTVSSTGASRRAVATLGAAPPAGATVTLWSKPMSGLTDWAATAMSPVPGSPLSFEAPALPGDAIFAVEVAAGPGAAWRYPDVLAATPYLLAP